MFHKGVIPIWDLAKRLFPKEEPNEFFLTDGTKFKLKYGYNFENFVAMGPTKLVCCMEVSREFRVVQPFHGKKNEVPKGPPITPGLIIFRQGLADELKLPQKPCNPKAHGREYEVDLVESFRTHAWMWELLYFMEAGQNSSSVHGSEAEFTPHIVKMNDPVHLLMIIVQVHAHMHEVAHYRENSNVERSPAFIFFEKDVDRSEFKLFLRLPKKPASVSHVSHEGNPWNIGLSEQSKEAVFDCADFMVDLVINCDPLLGRIDDFIERGRMRNLWGRMIGDRKQRFSMIQLYKELSVILSSQPWIDTNYVAEFYSIKKGLCIIINNYNFIDEKRKRKGSDSDVDALCNTFGTILGFRVETHQDLTADEIRQLVTDFPKKDYLQHYDCVIFCLMSHGSEGVIYGVDDEPVKIREELIYAINDKTCPQLKDKPKVWITNACRDIIPTSFSQKGENLVKALWSELVKSDKQIAPSLWLSSTMPGHTSKRIADGLPNPGSPYIQALCKNLDSVDKPGFYIKDLYDAHEKTREELKITISQTPADPVEFGLKKKIGFLRTSNQLENVPRKSGAVIVEYCEPSPNLKAIQS